jgi:hypothetical protein
MPNTSNALLLLLQLLHFRCCPTPQPRLTPTQALGCEASLLATDWYLCLFATSLPAETAARVWDCLLLEGRKVLHRLGLALLAKAAPLLMQLDNAGGGAGVGLLESVHACCAWWMPGSTCSHGKRCLTGSMGRLCMCAFLGACYGPSCFLSFHLVCIKL